MSNAQRDGNFVPGLVAQDASTGLAFPVLGNSTTGRLYVDSNGSGSSATQVVVTAGTITIAGGTVAVTGITVSSGTTNVNITQIATQPVITTGVAGALPMGGDTASGATDSGNPVKVGAKYNNVLPTFTDGQRGDLQIGTRGSLRTEIWSQGGSTAITLSQPTSDASSGAINMIPVRAFGEGFNGTTWDRVYTANSDAQGTIGVLASGNMVFNGTTWDRMRSGGVTGALSVDGDTASGVADAGNPVKVGGKYNTTKPTFTDGQRGDLQIGTRGSIQTALYVADSTTQISVAAAADGAANPAVASRYETIDRNTLFNGTTWDRAHSAAGTIGVTAVGGFTASAGALIVAPVTIGGRASTANPTAVTDGQVIDATFDKVGKQVTVSNIRALRAATYNVINNSTATAAVINAGGAGVFNDVYGVMISNTASAANLVSFSDAGGGATKFSIEVPSNDTRGFMLPADAGYPQTTSANQWQAQCSVAGSINVTLFYVSNV